MNVTMYKINVTRINELEKDPQSSRGSLGLGVKTWLFHTSFHAGSVTSGPQIVYL